LKKCSKRVLHSHNKFNGTSSG